MHHFALLGGPGGTGFDEVRFPVCLVQLVLLGPPSIDNGTHGTEKLMLKTQVSEDFA